MEILCKVAMGGVLEIRYFVENVHFFVKKKIECLAHNKEKIIILTEHDIKSLTDAIPYS